MLIDGQKLIDQQLTITAKQTVSFDGGTSTVLTPVHYLPQPDGGGRTVSLDGDWRVAKWPFGGPEADLAGQTTDDASWPTVPQPGKVFSLDPTRSIDNVPNWNRVGLDHIDADDGAMLRRAIEIPAAWCGKRVILRFDAIYPAACIYLNGELLGEHLSGLTPVEYEITERVTPGAPALVAVRLLRKHKFVKMDMVRHSAEFAGLAQSACIFAVEPCLIRDCFMPAGLNDDFTTGRVAGTVSLANTGNAAASGTLAAVLRDADGLEVTRTETPVSLAAGAEEALPLELLTENPALWNDEFPNLYTVALDLQINGQEPQQFSWRCGFRSFDLDNERPTLNGSFVKFRGVNHLTYHPEGGMHTPRAWLRQNLELMKKANVNTIRTHFLGPRYLAELCDELGLYLLQELPIDWGTNYIHDPEWVGPAMMRIAGGVLRDRHHASVVVWSVGNENMPESLEVSEDGYNHLRTYDRFTKTLDPTRPTMFPPPGPANKVRGIFEVRVGDIGDTHYSFNLAKDFLATREMINPKAWTGEMERHTWEEARALGWSGVWFSSEYGIMNMMPDLLHAPYGSIIDDVKEEPLSGRNSQEVFYDRLRREWGFMRAEPTCLGGAYFPWICAATGDNPWGWTVWAEDNDWGVVTADLTPKSFFWVMRVLFSPVWFPETLVWRKGETSLKLEMTNQYNQIDLKDCTLRTLQGGGTGLSALRWQDIPVACAPGETKTIEIPIWNSNMAQALEHGATCVCRCVLLDPTGFRPITADILVVPEQIEQAEEKLAIGPDAILDHQ